MVKVKVITEFTDQINGFVRRPINEVFECSEGRAKSLADRGLVVKLNKIYKERREKHE